MPRGVSPGRRPAAKSSAEAVTHDPQARKPDRTAQVTHLRGSVGRPPAARSPPAGGSCRRRKNAKTRRRQRDTGGTPHDAAQSRGGSANHGGSADGRGTGSSRSLVLAVRAAARRFPRTLDRCHVRLRDRGGGRGVRPDHSPYLQAHRRRPGIHRDLFRRRHGRRREDRQGDPGGRCGRSRSRRL